MWQLSPSLGDTWPYIFTYNNEKQILSCFVKVTDVAWNTHRIFFTQFPAQRWWKQWRSLSAGEADKTFQFDRNNLSIRERRPSGPLHRAVILLILTLITVCSSVNTGRLMADGGRKTQNRRPTESINRLRGQHVHVCHLTSHEHECVIIIHWAQGRGGNERMTSHWYTARQIYVYVFLINNTCRKTGPNNHADFHARGLDLFSSGEGWRISKHCGWNGLLCSCCCTIHNAACLRFGWLLRRNRFKLLIMELC